MPEDVGGTPFPDGWEPDDDHDHGVSDEEFASVVFDEAFVQAATVHEPTAVERLLAAAQARAEASEAEARRAHARGEHYDDAYGPEGTDFGQDPDDDELDDELEDTYVLGDRHFGRYGKQVRWHRPVAWVLAVVMGIGMVALAFAAVYRGGSAGTRDGIPTPAPTGLEQGSAAAPSVSADTAQPPASAIPRSP
ncbi:SCO2584 family spore wall biosynthesis protein [Streptomyces puniciscabiei]